MALNSKGLFLVHIKCPLWHDTTMCPAGGCPTTSSLCSQTGASQPGPRILHLLGLLGWEKEGKLVQRLLKASACTLLARTGHVAWVSARPVLRCLEELETSVHSTDEAHTPSATQPKVCIPFFYFYSILDKVIPHVAWLFILSFVNIKSDIHRVSRTFLLPRCHGTRCLSSC